MIGRTTLLILLMVALTGLPAIAAQRGPQPGMTPEEYAMTYAQEQAGSATSDPAGYAAKNASPEGVANQTGEAAYIACWAADDTSGQDLPVCDAFYQAPGRAARPTRQTNDTAALDDGVGAAQDLANTTVDAVEQIVADPTSAPGQAQRILDAVTAFAGQVVAIVQGIVGGLSTGMVAGWFGLIHGLQIGGQTIATAASVVGGLVSKGVVATSDGTVAVVSYFIDATASGAQLIANGFSSALSGVSTAATWCADAIAGGISATVSGAASAATLTGRGMAAAASAVGTVASEAASTVSHIAGTIADTVGGWFGGHAHAAAAGQQAPSGVAKTGADADGLLQGVRSKLPL